MVEITLLQRYIPLSMVIFSLLMPLLSANNCFAENCALIVGGGGELAYNNSIDKTNRFAPILLNYFKALNARGWDVKIIWDFKNYPSSLGPAVVGSDLNPENIENALKELLTGECSEVLVIGINHGSEEGLHHGWIMPDITTFDLSRLKQTIAKRAKGVKVGLIDESCFSGNAIDQLADVSDCVISSAGRNFEAEIPSMASIAAYFESLPVSNKFSMTDHWHQQTSWGDNAFFKADSSQLKIFNSNDTINPISKKVKTYVTKHGSDSSNYLKAIQLDSEKWFAPIITENSLLETWNKIVNQETPLSFAESYNAKAIENSIELKRAKKIGACDDFEL